MLMLRELPPGREAEWDLLVARSPRGLLFHITDWLKIISATQRLELVRLGIFEQDRLVGVFPYFLKRFGPLRVAGSPLVVEDTHYLGPVVPDRYLPAVMGLFQNHVRQAGIHHVRVIFQHDQAKEPFVTLGYECVDRITHVVNLAQDSVALWKRVKPPCQRQIRKAAREGVVTEIVTDGRFLLPYLDLVTHLYNHQGRTPPSPKEFFTAIWDRFGEKGELVWAVAKYRGELVAAALLGLWKGWVFFLDGACNKEKTRLGPNNALHWAAILWAKSQGYQYYDFVGSNVPRFFQFKSSFGGDLNHQLSLEFSRPRVVRTLREHYAAYKTLMARLKFLQTFQNHRHFPEK